MTNKQLLTYALGTALAVSGANAATVTQNNEVDNAAWTLPGFSVENSEERYDQRSLTISGAQGFEIDSVRILLDTSGTFDDSLAIDIDADGVIDFVASQSDAYATAGVGNSGGNAYTPWNDASRFTLDFTITAAGTDIKAYWGGIEIDVGSGLSEPGFNNISSFTLQDWGLTGTNQVPSDNFTSTSTRLGSLDETGPDGSNLDWNYDAVVVKDKEGKTTVYDPDGDGVPPEAIPEPSSALLVGISGALALLRRRRA